MPLSEGATRARHARRLLQRVLDYAPRGTTIHPLVRIGRHAAEGIVEASAEQEADLIIFGWGGKTGARDQAGPTVFSSTIDEVVRDSPCDIAVVKQRGSRTIKRVLVPVRGGPHAELALRYADAIARHHDATVVVLHLVPPGITMAVRAQAEHALAAFIKQHLKGRGEALLKEAPNVRNAILREAERSDLVVMGASATAAGANGETYLFGALPEAIAARAKPSVVVVKTRDPIERATFDRLATRAETLAAADRAAEEARAVPAKVERWFGESNFHHAEFMRPAAAGRAQGEAGRDGQPGPADAQRGGDDRADRPAGDARDGRARAAARRGPRHRFDVDGPDARDRRGRGRPGRAAPGRPAALRLVRGQGRGALEVALSRRPATSSCGPTRT